MPKWRPVTWVILAFNLLVAAWAIAYGNSGESGWASLLIVLAVPPWLLVNALLWFIWAFTKGRGPKAPQGPPALWCASEPGVELAAAIHGEPVAHLAAGTVVTEVGRVLGQVRVTTAEGLSGWVAEDRLQPPGSGAANPAGAP
jgi:hypothetical protein